MLTVYQGSFCRCRIIQVPRSLIKNKRTSNAKLSFLLFIYFPYLWGLKSITAETRCKESTSRTDQQSITAPAQKQTRSIWSHWLTWKLSECVSTWKKPKQKSPNLVWIRGLYCCEVTLLLNNTSTLPQCGCSFSKGHMFCYSHNFNMLKQGSTKTLIGFLRLNLKYKTISNTKKFYTNWKQTSCGGLKLIFWGNFLLYIRAQKREKIHSLLYSNTIIK